MINNEPKYSDFRNHYQKFLGAGVIGLLCQMVMNNLFWFGELLYSFESVLFLFAIRLWLAPVLRTLVALGFAGLLLKYRSRLGLPLAIIYIVPYFASEWIATFLGFLGTLLESAAVMTIVAMMLMTVREKVESKLLLYLTCTLLVLNSFAPSLLMLLFPSVNPIILFIVQGNFYGIFIVFLFLLEIRPDIFSRRIIIVDDYGEESEIKISRLSRR
ncbi:MAG: hypothetical protein ACFFCP_13650 [Promethearchaeota archaeon]